VIAYAAGGALETVIPGRTGLYFQAQDTASLVAALKDFHDDDFDPAAIRRHAEQFDVPHFHEQIAAFVGEVCRGRSLR